MNHQETEPGHELKATGIRVIRDGDQNIVAKGLY